MGAVVEDMAAVGDRIRVDVVLDVDAVHWRWSGTDVGHASRRRPFCRSVGPGAGKDVRRYIAVSKVDVEGQTFWAFQPSSLAAGAAEVDL